jgi:hypothetical protein
MWMLISIAIILAAAGALGWRMTVGVIAERPISDRLRYAVAPVAPAPSDFSGADFALLERLFRAAGAFGGVGRSAPLIRAYFRLVRALGQRSPSLTSWSEREMKICSRYLAAQIEHLLDSNAACSRRAHTL